jgi:hypothetical protein
VQKKVSSQRRADHCDCRHRKRPDGEETMAQVDHELIVMRSAHDHHGTIVGRHRSPGCLSSGSIMIEAGTRPMHGKINLHVAYLT